MSNRRNWLKQVGLGTIGLGLTSFEAFANPSPENYISLDADKSPILLRSNENPYGPSPLARSAMQKSINNSNRYGWNLSGELISLIAKKNNVSDNNILLGAGSTEILDLVLQYTALKKGNYILAETTFNYWTFPSEKLGIKKITVPLTADKKHDLAAMLKAIDSDTKMIYICNPNNPTGTICDHEQLVSFVKEASKNAIVFVDEAYIDFTKEQSLSSLVMENKNLIITKTFSKMHGLAGARIGYAIAASSTIDELSALKSSPNLSVSVVSTAAAMASLNDEKFIKEVYSLNEEVKKYTIDQLTQLNLTCIPSYSNFIYFSLENYKKDFFKQLEANNIEGTKIYEENGKWTRITIGTMKEMQQFIEAIK
ncbi:aminotransferase class V-fold PLP-dependent enzyme [Flavobacterium sp. WLB]|uniref:pyridoxal phosphate-dependent aminotransferase n=1 Tax=unclassified Flavobacterium TaxID=196869 RepID=UPI0006AB95BB|nr:MULTISPECIES: histidinol-phosphate transaminase [unclassified Flavobacterium]KOP37823.1 aminotransferase class I/II [Flavobacterium sp. VMW]OWU90946.1 aminotransferase class I/II [Flavobacterium sp. NLM]PUU70011.1 aminotransferase class V-fold PLP-dependent enzyme [Flavobacterium sp. WLB]